MDNLVLKIGGSELASETFMSGLTAAISTLRRVASPIVVHGGGKKIAELQSRLGLHTRFVEGLRVTDPESLEVAEMVLSGSMNKALTARFVSAGIPSIGLSGVDWGLLKAEQLHSSAGDLGLVGRIISVNTEALEKLLTWGVTPVISPISLGAEGQTYNVNADHAATAIAVAMRASAMVFLTNVPGVMLGDLLVHVLTSQDAEALISANEIRDGMVPKVRSALEAISSGVPEVRITDLKGLVDDGGTRVVA
jgi:acetylglutamate kinase